LIEARGFGKGKIARPAGKREAAAVSGLGRRFPQGILAPPFPTRMKVPLRHLTTIVLAVGLCHCDSVARLFDQLRCGPGDWRERAAGLGTRIAPASERSTDPASLDAVFPAAKVNGHIVHENRRTEGVGVPVVGWKSTSPVGQKRGKFLLPNGLPYNLTATLSFGASKTPVWHFDKRWTHDNLTIGSTTHTLAADWTAPNAFYWEMCELDDLLIQNVILPDRFTEETGIYFVTPYDPDKIPVVFVHGLVSSPDAFKNLINELAPEPWFREHYQIWLYNYPTGNPWIYSGMHFREKMREATAYARTKGHDRQLNRMVVVAHSMGGLIARSSVTDPEPHLRRVFQAADRTPEIHASHPAADPRRHALRAFGRAGPRDFHGGPASRQPDGESPDLDVDFQAHPPAENPDRRAARHHPFGDGRRSSR
jgi:pimeloyl-ACP methyl ester carboxylesterase